jgi:hypothetical protein
MAHFTTRTIPATEKKEIVSNLEKSIKKYGSEKTKAVINHYFKNYQERQKAKKRIEELQKEIQQLEKKRL